MEYVIKRDGSRVKFDASKISNAILKAFKDVDNIITNNAKYIANGIAEDIANDDRFERSVEDIQDEVIFGLMETNRKDIAKAYCEYRFERQLIRERSINTTDKTILEIADGTNEYWNTENSNKNPRLNTTVRDYMAGETSTDITTRLLLPKDIVEADKEGIIHFHDKDYFVQHSHNCFTEYTSFVTKDGIRAFYQYNDGDPVTVLDKNGDWRKATVHKYEDQMMQIVTFTDGENDVNVSCTYDHRWVMLDGSVRTRLNVGDKIALTPEMRTYPTNYQPFIEKEPEIFSLGKDLILENPDKRSDAIRKLITDQEYHNYTDDQKIALIFGILLGYDNEWDFGKSKNSILVYDVEIINIIYSYSVMIGYHVLSIEMTVSTTNDGVKRDAWVIQLMKKQEVGTEWTVKNIVPYNNNIRVASYCVEEPITKTFTLANGIVTGNCDLVNLKDMLMNGTVISEVMIDKPHSFSTACTVATQIIAQVASFQYGGQSISLAHLAPFVDVSRQAFKTEVIFELEDTLFKMVKDINNPLYGRHIPLSKSSDPVWDFTLPEIIAKYHQATGKEYIPLNPDGTATKEALLEIAKINIRDVFTDEMIDAMVNDRLKKEISKGIQTIQYQIITLMTTNGQAPFLTLFMYLSEAENEQEKKDLAMLIEETLHQSILGVKNKEGVYITPAFPKIIFVTEECNIHPDSEYYYLLELAAKCSNKRLTPDYISEKIMKELKEGNCYPVMGCVDGSEFVTYKYNDELYLECFSEMWTRISNDISPEAQHPSNPVGLFINTESNNLKIYDSAEGFVQVKKVIRNTTRKWYHIELEDGKTLTCTPDHPLPVYQKGRCEAQTLEVGDKLYVNNEDAYVFSFPAIKSIRVEQLDHEEYSYDVETESDHFEVSGIYSHNCRSALNVYKNENGEYQFYGRFNQGVVTLNLVDLALSSKGDFDKFWELFEERTELCHRALRCRHERLKGTVSDVAPILWQHGALARLEEGQTIDHLLYGGYSSISLGYAGLYECVKYMTGKSHSEPGESEEFGLKVMQFMNDKCAQWKADENIAYSLYGTPLESTTYKFSKCLKKRFGDDIFIKMDGFDRNYITNSYHIPVFEKIDAFTKLEKEAKFQNLSPGGSISYVEIPNLDNNTDAIIQLIQFMYDHNMYAELNGKSDYCEVCGYDKEISLIDENGKLLWECPNCGCRDPRKLDIARRTCGYKGTAKNGWNQGRLGDIHDRVLHIDDIEAGE